MIEEIINNGTEGTEGTEGTAGSQQGENKTYTQEEVLKLIQAESDKRVSAALKSAEKKWQKKMSLSQLDDEAREKAEKDDKIAELEQQLAQFQIEKNKSELKSVLSSRGLSAEFADILSISDDLETSQANIDKLDKLFKAAVKAEVEKRLAGNSPKGSGGQSQPMTKEEFLKLPMHEMQRLMDSNKEFYTNLLK